MSYFFNSNQTGFCQTPEVISKISNLTASYAASGNGGGRQELMTMVCAPIIMFILIALFLCGAFDVRAVLSPNLRLLLSSALALFLPVMSYLFSEAKDAAGGGCQRPSAMSEDLSVRARVILTWMLLVELLRKKADEMRMWGSYSSSIQRAGRVVWLGSLVYFNITSPGRKAVFSVLWILCAVKLLQRIVFTEVEKRSYPDKSWLISSYMAEIMSPREEIDHMGEVMPRRREEIDDQGMAIDGREEFLRRCDYIVMGEEKLGGEVTADGYKSIRDITYDRGILTVGNVWELAEADCLPHSIMRVCLSFALFKLLRRRFEHLPPMTAEEGRNCRKILLSRDLHPRGDNDGEVGHGALFSVMADEVKFFSEYYHSVVPVVLASPLFVLVNYFLVPVVVLILCLIAILVCGCGHGGMSYALRSMSTDNYALQPGFAKLAICAVVRSGHSRPAFFFTLDLLVTFILLIIFFVEEVCEFLTVLTSNWFIISMLCNVTKLYYWHESGTFRWILWLRRKMSKYTNIRLKQFSILPNHRGPRLIAALVPSTLYRLNVTSVPMRTYLKESIGERLQKQHLRFGDAPIVGLAQQFANAHLGLRFRRTGLRTDDYYCYLLHEYRSDSVTEVILTWHIATCLLEDRFPPARIRGGGMMKEEAAAAVSLSRYCAYLVVFHPELLPDRRAKAELVLKEAKEELRNLLGFWGYYLSLPRARAQKLFDSIRPADPDAFDSPIRPAGRFAGRFADPDSSIRPAGRFAHPDGVVDRAIRLAKHICEPPSDLEVFDQDRWKWRLLSQAWTELIVYAAPAAASDEEQLVKAHADTLVEGVELITVLWAFAMHTGMQRASPTTTRADCWNAARSS